MLATSGGRCVALGQVAHHNSRSLRFILFFDGEKSPASQGQKQPRGLRPGRPCSNVCRGAKGANLKGLEGPLTKNVGCPEFWLRKSAIPWAPVKTTYSIIHITYSQICLVMFISESSEIEMSTLW